MIKKKIKKIIKIKKAKIIKNKINYKNKLKKFIQEQLNIIKK